MEVIRQDNRGFNRKRMARPCLAKRRAQQADVFGQQSKPPIGEIDGEEIAAAMDKASSVVGHRPVAGAMGFPGSSAGHNPSYTL